MVLGIPNPLNSDTKKLFNIVSSPKKPRESKGDPASLTRMFLLKQSSYKIIVFIQNDLRCVF